MNETRLKENVLLIDADFADKVAADLSATFEQRLQRQLPLADLAEWLVCLGLDGGVPQGKNEVQCLFVHQKEKKRLDHFLPGDFAEEIDGSAFMDQTLGEFLLSSLEVEPIAGDDFFLQCAEVILNDEHTKRVILVPGWNCDMDRLKQGVEEHGKGKQISLFSLQPVDWFAFCQLGFSLMRALGVKGDEL